MFNLVPWLCFAFATGIVLADGGWIDAFHAHRAAAAALVIASLPARRAGWKLVCLVLAFAALGAAALAGRLEASADSRLTRPLEGNIEAWVCAAPAGREFVQIEICGVRGVGTPRLSVPRRILLGAGFDPDARARLVGLRRGQAIRARIRVLPPRAVRNPGDRHDPRRLARRGIGARAYLVAPQLIVRLSARDRVPAKWISAPGAWLEMFRARVGSRLSALGPGGELLRALAIGERRGLAPEQRSAFTTLGISHLLAVSGLHVALVAGIAYALLRRALVRIEGLASSRDVRRLALSGAILCALAYALLSGWGIPVRRAFLFLSICAIALGLGRPVSAIQLVCLTALGVLIASPHALFEIGAQLSFIATAALLFVFGSEHREDETGRGAIASLLRTSTIAIAVTAPLIARIGGVVSPVALVANLFAVPFTGFVLLPLALLAVPLGFLSGIAGFELALVLAAGVADFSLATIEVAADLLPRSWKSAGRPPVAVLLASVVFAGLALRSRSTLRGLGWVLISTGLLTLAPARAVSPAPPRVVSFDVGLGDATLVEGRAAAILVDAGRLLDPAIDMGRHVVVPALQALSVEALDLVVATHADLDHRGGLPAVLDSMSVATLWLPVGGMHDPAFAQLVDAARRREVEIEEVGAGMRRTFRDLAVEVLWPPADRAKRTRNEASLVLRVTLLGSRAESRRVLLVGDIGARSERSLLARGASLQAEILKVAHHGSRNSSTRAFLEAVKPEISLISASCASRMALPTQEVIERLRAAGSQVHWTGRDGAIAIGFDFRRGVFSTRHWVSGVTCRAAPSKKNSDSSDP